MSKEEIGRRMRQVREHELGMAQKELSRLTGIPTSTLSKLENNRQEGSSDVALIAEHLNVNALWLSHGRGPKHLKTDKVPHDLDSISGDVLLYQFADPRCKHGPTYNSQTAKHLGLQAFPVEVFTRLGIDPDNCFAHVAADSGVGLAGDSMLVHAIETDPRQANGKAYAIKQGISLLVRNIFVSATGGYRLSSDNTDKAVYPDEHVPLAEVDSLEIVGRVRYVGGVR